MMDHPIFEASYSSNKLQLLLYWWECALGNRLRSVFELEAERGANPLHVLVSSPRETDQHVLLALYTHIRTMRER